jgi:predicted nucleic acid-binding Zn ribbon protein
MKIICDTCGKEFDGKKGTRFCSDECRLKGWRKYMRERTMRKRINLKLSDEARKRMQWLMENQETEKDYILEKECFICGKGEKDGVTLLAHHVRYNPPLKKTLCYSCHQWLNWFWGQRMRAQNKKL